MSSTPKVAIIIVNYKTPELTIACINSIFEHVVSCRCEIIVVDNNSGDASIEMIKNAFIDKIILIESPENLGFGRANNLGASYSNAEYYFFLNSDTVLKNDVFRWFLNFYESKPDVGAIGAYLIDGSGEESLSGGSTYSAKKYLRVAFNGLSHRKTPKEVIKSDKPIQCDYIIGADLFVSSALYNSVGGFNPRIFMYFEDVELCARFQAEGKNNYIIPGPEIIHFVKSSSNSQFSRVHNTASLMYCLKNKMNPFNFRLFQLGYFLLKSPLLLRCNTFKKEFQYVSAIYNYKKYLVNDTNQ